MHGGAPRVRRKRIDYQSKGGTTIPLRKEEVMRTMALSAVGALTSTTIRRLIDGS